MLKKLKSQSFLLLSLVLIIFAVLPLFHPGLFNMHDNEQVGRLFEMNQALKAGQFPVRIIQDLGFGYGYLLFNFYPPFVYYLGEVFKVLGFSYIDSIKLVMGSGFVLSALFMYLFTKEYFGRIGALVASVFYTYALYHSVDLYVRGALPEFFSFAFVPAVFWSYLMLSKTGKKRYVVLSSIFSFLLVITHNLVVLMAFPFIAAYILFLFFQTRDKKFILRTLFSGAIAFLLSSFFIIPALLENNQTMVSLLTKELADYNIHFVYPQQLWDSPWGYGGSTKGLSDGLSFKIGKFHIILTALASVLFLFQASKKKGNFVIPLFLVF